MGAFDDPLFARQAVERGLSIVEAKGEYCDVLQARLGQALREERTRERTAGPAPVASSANGPLSSSLYSAATHLAAERKCTFREAMSDLAAEDPERYQAQRGRMGV